MGGILNCSGRLRKQVDFGQSAGLASVDHLAGRKHKSPRTPETF
jgi:hypothetical protein